MSIMKIRQAIQRIAAGSCSGDDEECLTSFVAGEVYGMLKPSADQPGSLFGWLLKHGYSDQALRSMLFQYQTEDGIPGIVAGWAAQITSALIASNTNGSCCNCAESAHSRKAQIAATKRCALDHHLTAPNLHRYAVTAPERVRKSYVKQRKKPSVQQTRKSIIWHSDPVTFVCRAVHGNSKNLVLSSGRGARSFGHSMLCAVFSTPQGSQLRVKRWKKKEYVLYDTRNGIEGEWKSESLVCLTCASDITDPQYTPCFHPLRRQVHFENEPPTRTCDIDVAKCAVRCVGEGGLPTIWLWNDTQKRCPRCGHGRTRHRMRIKAMLPSEPEQDEEYRRKQMDEDIPYDGSPELDD